MIESVLDTPEHPHRSEKYKTGKTWRALHFEFVSTFAEGSVDEFDTYSRDKTCSANFGDHFRAIDVLCC